MKAKAAPRRPVPAPKSRASKAPSRGLRPWHYAAAVATAVVAVGVLVAVSQLGGGEKAAPPQTIVGAAEASSLLDGIPQDGAALGDPNAPVTLVEYADLQCPFCAQFARDVFPILVDEYVRTGKVRVVFRGLAFIGAESEAALRAVLAAGDQDKLWYVQELLSANQGEENGGWVTDGLLEGAAASVAGLDAAKLMRDRSAGWVTDAMAADQLAADAAGINSTPSFELGPTGGQLERLEVAALDPAAFRPALDALLAQ